VESNPADHTVGFGGYPNLLGEVELDASVMEGATRRAGTVGALRGYRHAILVARAVFDRLPHVTVVGEGAARLAAEIGLEPEDLLTEEAEAMWRKGVQDHLGEGSTDQAADSAAGESLARHMLSVVSKLVADPDRAPGTVNVMAIDDSGHMASAVSTSGWAWKYPGRLGDTPVIGAGNYCDDRFGAAACTGWGELAIRAGTARAVVSLMARGASPTDALVEAIADLATLGEDPAQIVMHAVALAADGSHAAVSTTAGARYVFRDNTMDGWTRAARLHVPVA
jgi:beta-aspartyl-peptidase (threonine type)